MSSSRFRKPEYRLRLGYPDIILERAGSTTPLAVASPGPAGYAAGLREVAAAAPPGRTPVTVVLPESAVWRGQLELSNGSRAARRRAAQAAAARHLDVPADAIVVALGVRTASGTPVAAVARSALADTQALVAASGLRAAAITGAGDFPGFADPPRLAGGWRPQRAPAPIAAAIGAGALAALIALIAAQSGTATRGTAPVSPAMLAEAPQLTPAPVVTPVVTAAPSPSPAPDRRAESRVPSPLRVTPPPVRPAAPPAGAVTVATRNVTLVAPSNGGPPALRLPPIARSSGPLPRPHPALAPAPVSTAGDLRPRPRPGHAEAAPAAKPADDAPLSAADARPLPRPNAGTGVKVASLEPTAGIASLAALAAEPAPPPRPAGLRHKAAAVHAKPKVVHGQAAKKPLAKAKPAPAAAPQRVVTVRKAAKPVVNTAPLRVASAPSFTVAPVQKALVVQAPRVSPAAQYPARKVRAVAAPARSTNPSSPRAVAAATQRVGVDRGGVTLIGIFGNGAGRHALLKMPNGRVQRVAAGDQVAGMQIAAVGADSVQVNNRGRASILTLPD